MLIFRSLYYRLLSYSNACRTIYKQLEVCQDRWDCQVAASYTLVRLKIQDKKRVFQGFEKALIFDSLSKLYSLPKTDH